MQLNYVTCAVRASYTRIGVNVKVQQNHNPHWVKYPLVDLGARRRCPHIGSILFDFHVVFCKKWLNRLSNPRVRAPIWKILDWYPVWILLDIYGNEFHFTWVSAVWNGFQPTVMFVCTTIIGVSKGMLGATSLGNIRSATETWSREDAHVWDLLSESPGQILLTVQITGSGLSFTRKSRCTKIRVPQIQVEDVTRSLPFFRLSGEFGLRFFSREGRLAVGDNISLSEIRLRFVPLSLFLFSTIPTWS